MAALGSETARPGRAPTSILCGPGSGRASARLCRAPVSRARHGCGVTTRSGLVAAETDADAETCRGHRVQILRRGGARRRASRHFPPKVGRVRPVPGLSLGAPPCRRPGCFQRVGRKRHRQGAKPGHTARGDETAPAPRTLTSHHPPTCLPENITRWHIAAGSCDHEGRDDIVTSSRAKGSPRRDSTGRTARDTRDS